jgi:hypothetical protein
MNHKWTPEEIQFLKDNIAGRNYTELAELLNRKYHLSMKGDQLRNSLLYYDPTNTLASKHHRYTPEEIQFIRDNLLPGRSYTELTDMFNRQFGCLINKNMLSHIIKRNKLCGFHRTGMLPDKTERKYGGYIYVKIGKPDKWKSKHSLIWEAANGPIPKGHTVIFADGNKSNFDLDNLLLVSRSELAVMNNLRLIFPDKDLTKAGKKIAALNLQISECERKLGQRHIKKRKKRNEKSS